MKDDVEDGQTIVVKDEEEEYMNAKKRKRVVLICILLVVVCSIIIVPISIHYDNLEIAHYVKVDNLVKHLEVLEEIALRDNNSRTATTAFNESLVYIKDLLDDYGDYYQIKIQNFTYMDFIELETPVLKIGQRGLVDKVDFRNMRYSGVGNLTNVPVFSVGVGCTNTDWANFPKDKTHVAVIARNDLIECNVQKKITMAIENEAIAVIMYHIEGSNSLFQMGLSSIAPFPVFAVGHDLGREIADLEVGKTVSLYSNNTQNLLYTSNLIVETTKGSSYSTIVIGSHLDSVAKGPGINDNGSGSVATLEIALLLAKKEFENKNRLRFIWFGAEELGLLGSKYYVDSLTPLELSKIVMNLNFDMLASPNYIMGIYNGTSHSQQSAEIQLVFEKYFEQNGWPFIPTPFDGRSDYGPFLDKGIPCGGLETGADGIKTVEEFHKFGGVCYVMHDPCYHSKCDTLDNVNRLALIRNTKAAAHTIEFFSGVEGLNQK